MVKLVITSTVLAGQENLYKHCLETFTQKMLGVDWKGSQFILNVDPTPMATASEDSFKSILDQFTANSVVLAQTKASFPLAVERTWKKAFPIAPEYFFHLEGDWGLTHKVHIDELITPLLSPEVYSTTLRYYSFKAPKLCLMPSLWKTDKAQELLAGGFDPKQHNPECELRERLELKNKINHREKKKIWKNVHHPTIPAQKVLADLGTAWKKQAGVKPNGIGKSYTKII